MFTLGKGIESRTCWTGIAEGRRFSARSIALHTLPHTCFCHWILMSAAPSGCFSSFPPKGWGTSSLSVAFHGDIRFRGPSRPYPQARSAAPGEHELCRDLRAGWQRESRWAEGGLRAWQRGWKCGWTLLAFFSMPKLLPAWLVVWAFQNASRPQFGDVSCK